MKLTLDNCNTSLWWLAHSLSYNVVSWVFQIPRATACSLIPRGVGRIVVQQHENINLTAARKLEEIALD